MSTFKFIISNKIKTYFRKQLGGKLGTTLQNELCVDTVGDLLKFSEEKLQERYGINTGLLSAFMLS